MTLPTTYIDWHCTNCGHEHETNQQFYSYPVTCPSCGEKSTRRGHPILPTNKVYCDSEPHRYSFTSSDEKIQVYMRSITGKSCGVTLDPENVPDCDNDPIEVTKEVLSILNRYIYTSAKERVEVVLNDMIAHRAESENNERLNRIHELRKSIVLDSLEYEELGQISFIAIKEEKVWIFDHEFQNTIKEPLCNGTEWVLDEYFQIDMNRPPIKNDQLKIVASTEPFDDYDTELILQSTNEDGSVYLDTTLYEEVWLCPWLRAYFQHVPEKLYVRLDAVNPGVEAFKRRTGV